MVRAASLLVGLVLLVSACAPRLSPTYRDFRHSVSADTLQATLRTAAEEAGWAPAPSPDPQVVATAPRPVGGLGRTVASVEMVPLGGGVVRVWVRGETRGLFGRTKLYGLSPTVREQVLSSLSAALAARGFQPLDEPRRRDRAVG